MRHIILLLSLLFLTPPPSLAQTPIPEYREILRIERGPVLAAGGFVEMFAFNPDGSQIAAATSHNTVNIWDIQSGAIIRTWEQHASFVSWSPDGRFIAAGGSNDGIHMWNAETGILLYQFEDYYSTARYAAWSPDSIRLATSHLSVLDIQTGEIIQVAGSEYPSFHGGSAHVSWSPDASMIAVTSVDYAPQDLNIWSLDGERLDTYWGGVTASWSADSALLATTSQVRDIATGLPVVIIPEMGRIIEWHPDGEWIGSTGNLRTESRDTVYLWSATTGELVTAWTIPDCWLRGFTWSADGDRFAVNCSRNLLEPESRSSDLLIWERVP